MNVVGYRYRRIYSAALFRPVAQFGRAAVSKTAGWGFESLLACHEQSLAESEIGNMSTDYEH